MYIRRNVIRALYALTLLLYTLGISSMVFMAYYGKIQLPRVELPKVELPQVDTWGIYSKYIPQVDIPKLSELAAVPSGTFIVPTGTPTVSLGSAWNYAEPTATLSPAPTKTPAPTSTPVRPTPTPVNVLWLKPTATPKPCLTGVTIDGKTMLVSEQWLIEHGYPTWPGCRN